MVKIVDEDGAAIDVEEIASEIGDEIADAIEEQTDEIETNENDVETAMEIADASVAIAAIEADKEIKIAEIAADVELERIEAENEREETWQTELAEIKAAVSALTKKVETLLTPQPLTEQQAPMEPSLSLELETANNSTPKFTLAPTSETVMEVSLESGEEKQGQSRKPKRRLI